MQILVTGGTGFIGSHTVVELLDAGFEVVIIDNLYNSQADVIDKIKEIWCNTLRKQQRRDIMPDFYLTKMGHQFYERDIPKIAKSLERI